MSLLNDTSFPLIMLMIEIQQAVDFIFQAYLLKNILFVEDSPPPDNWRQLTG